MNWLIKCNIQIIDRMTLLLHNEDSIKMYLCKFLWTISSTLLLQSMGNISPLHLICMVARLSLQDSLHLSTDKYSVKSQ